MTVARFVAILFRYPGKGGWTFAPVPKKHAPPVTRGWGRTPVLATVDDVTFETSIWTDKKGQVLLPVRRVGQELLNELTGMKRNMHGAP